MTPDKIKLLLDSYYSGDISPDDYEALLSAMKEAKDLPPELENERRMLLSIDSYEPVMPADFEKMLSESIDKRSRKSNNILRVLLTGAAAAAVVLICVTIAMLNFGDKGLQVSDNIASSDIAHKDVTRTALPTVVTAAESGIKAESDEKTVSSEIEEESVIPEISGKELEKAGQIVDESLLNVLSMIHLAQDEVAESFENMQINQKINLNLNN